jgi:hypothetical protein
MSNNEHYLGNPLLKPANVDIEWTPELIEEYKKCMDNPMHFIENYIKIVSLDEGLVPFDMYDFQKKIVRSVHENRFTICKLPRQSGKTTTVVSYILHYVIFNNNMNVAILANKAATSRDILGRLQLAYENLPKWLQQGVMSWNKGSLELENGSKINASSTSSSAVRGSSYNLIFLDEFAFVPTHVAEDFFSSVYPTISSGKTTKMLIVSTPNGLNMFYKLWSDAEEGRNSYNPIEVHWSQVPGRDQKWKEETIRNTSEEQFEREFNCQFLGSSNTLIAGSKLKIMVYNNPIKSNAGFDQYVKPIEGRIYAITVDVARGVHNDFSAFIVYDVSQVPYTIVGKYKNNSIKPLVFPNVIFEIGKSYNQAYILVEINDIGEQVANALHYDLQYDNLILAASRGRSGQVLGQGFSGNKTQMGVKTTKTIKTMGCSNLKQLVEDDKLIINDFDLINELSSFVSVGQTFKAEEGSNDDLAMCCVLFAWMVDQTYFKDLTDVDIRAKMYAEQQKQLEEDMSPFGFISDGLEDENIGEMVDEYGTKWNPVVRTYDTNW